MCIGGTLALTELKAVFRAILVQRYIFLSTCKEIESEARRAPGGLGKSFVSKAESLKAPSPTPVPATTSPKWAVSKVLEFEKHRISLHWSKDDSHLRTPRDLEGLPVSTHGRNLPFQATGAETF